MESPSRDRPGPRRTAFTLIELLVVIAIIALLVSILLPSLKRARELAASSVCLTNERNIAQAVCFYANDENDAVPWNYLWNLGAMPWGLVAWDAGSGGAPNGLGALLLREYLGISNESVTDPDLKKSQVLRCPSTPNSAYYENTYESSYFYEAPHGNGDPGNPWPSSERNLLSTAKPGWTMATDTLQHVAANYGIAPHTGDNTAAAYFDGHAEMVPWYYPGADWIYGVHVMTFDLQDGR